MAKPLRLALGACIIQAEYGCSDEETARQIGADYYTANALEFVKTLERLPK